MSNIKNHLSAILGSTEDALGINASVGGQAISEMKIEQFIKEFKSNIASLSFGEKEAVLISMGRYMSSLSYLSARCTFFQSSFLDFQQHKRPDLLAEILSKFTKRDDITTKSSKLLVVLEKYLGELEKFSPNINNSLAYRYVRLWLSLMCYNDHVDASIVGTFITDQIRLYNLSYDSSESDKYLSKLRQDPDLEKEKRERERLQAMELERARNMQRRQQSQSAMNHQQHQPPQQPQKLYVHHQTKDIVDTRGTVVRRCIKFNTSPGDSVYMNANGEYVRANGQLFQTGQRNNTQSVNNVNMQNNRQSVPPERRQVPAQNDSARDMLFS